MAQKVYLDHLGAEDLYQAKRFLQIFSYKLVISPHFEIWLRGEEGAFFDSLGEGMGSEKLFGSLGGAAEPRQAIKKDKLY